MKALHQVGASDVEATARLFYEFETRKQWADAKPDIKKTWLEAAQQFSDITAQKTR